MTARIVALMLGLGAVACIGQETGETPSGAALYASYCSACHGETAEGDGPVAAVMQIAVPNLRALAMRNGGTFPTEAVTEYVDGTRVPPSHGSRQMPVWGEVFQWDADGASQRRGRQRIEAIVAYLEGIQY